MSEGKGEELQGRRESDGTTKLAKAPLADTVGGSVTQNAPKEAQESQLSLQSSKAIGSSAGPFLSRVAHWSWITIFDNNHLGVRQLNQDEYPYSGRGSGTSTAPSALGVWFLHLKEERQRALGLEECHEAL